MHRKQIVQDRTPGWRDSRHVCALTDGERHLGHIILKAGKWVSFDATHLDDARTGFRHLGTFHSLQVAKAAVECSAVCNWPGPGLFVV
jgi:hypothetical protein